jgi:hypothetical protein
MTVAKLKGAGDGVRRTNEMRRAKELRRALLSSIVIAWAAGFGGLDALAVDWRRARSVRDLPLRAHGLKYDVANDRTCSRVGKSRRSLRRLSDGAASLVVDDYRCVEPANLRLRAVELFGRSSDGRFAGVAHEVDHDTNYRR